MRTTNPESGALLIETIFASAIVMLSAALALSGVLKATSATRVHAEFVKPKCPRPGCSVEDTTIRCLCGKRSYVVIR